MAVMAEEGSFSAERAGPPTKRYRQVAGIKNKSNNENTTGPLKILIKNNFSSMRLILNISNRKLSATFFIRHAQSELILTAIKLPLKVFLSREKEFDHRLTEVTGGIRVFS
ncbi:hypothetical protein [Erwinia mallotivora]|uniref:hypothetical protein n=1 Tax=Erwinia mallotivora TaxID=69222 RepID=UPI0021C14959|nr:hypothetical protein [Erwinia mallotivora]